MTTFVELLNATEVTSFAADPRPGWAGPALLLNGRWGELLALSPDTDFLAAGIPFDGTASSRPGAAEGPAAIRQASMVFSSYVDSLGEHAMCDMRTDQVFHYRRGTITDVGDLHVYPTDTLKTFCAVAAEVRALAATGATLLLMGGDHSITFPTFAGWQAALAARHPRERLGFVQVDHHFDFGDHSAIHGPLYHGSNARRISELPGMVPARMAFVGVGSVTRKAQLDSLRAAGYHIVSVREIQQRGPQHALAATLAALREQCDAVYLSVDIDVADSSVAPGTGNVTIGGLTGAELFDVLQELTVLPVGAFDIAEVAPRYDPTGRTAHLAARLFFEFVYRAPLETATQAQLAEPYKSATTRFERLRQLLAQRLSDPDVAVQPYRDGVDSWVDLVKRPLAPAAVVRSAKIEQRLTRYEGLVEYGLVLEKEVTVARLLREAGIPTPEVLAWQRAHPPESEFSWMLMEFISHDSVEQLSDECQFQLGSLARQIHSIVPSGAALDQLATPENWQAWVRQRILRRIEAARRYMPLPPAPQVERLLSAALATRTAHSPGLLHLDLRPQNLAIKENRIISVFDLANALVGDPYLELARIRGCGLLTPKFLAGYGEAPTQLEQNQLALDAYELDLSALLVVVSREEADNLQLHQAMVERTATLMQRLGFAAGSLE